MVEEAVYSKFIINDEEKEYLSNKDKTFKMLIDKIGDINNYYIPNHYVALINSVVCQAISYKAATTIWNRFCYIVKDLNPDNVLNIEDEVLRSSGLSKSKVAYIKNISRAFKYKEINLNFNDMTNEEVIKELTLIKGIGLWTAQMFLTFSLFRKDIISYSDLAIRRGIEWLYEMDHDLTIKEFSDFEIKFSPYNTIASLYLWEISIRKLFEFDSIDKI